MLDFSSLCGALLSQLDKLYTESGELLSLANEKQAVLVSGEDYDALRDITAREEAHSDALGRLEEERISICSKIADMHGLDAKSITVSAIIELSGDVYGPKLREEAKRLNDRLLELKRTGSLNRELIEMKMSYAAFMLDTFSYEQEGLTSSYGASGEESSFDPRYSSIFDSEV